MGLFKRSTVLPIELITEGLPMIDTNHAQIHAKRGYVIDHKFSLGTGASGYVLFTVPAGTYVHWQGAQVSCDNGLVDAVLFEASTHSGGTALTPRNANRSGGSNDNSAITVAHTPTLDTDGTRLFGAYLGGGVKETGASLIPPEREFVFDPGVVYCVKLTNNDNATQNVHVSGFWYEEPAG